MSQSPNPRTGQAGPLLTRSAFLERYEAGFLDPRFDTERDAIARLSEIAWRNYCEGRKAPRTHEAGPGFEDPGYELSDEWRATREKILAVERVQRDPSSPNRILVVIGSPRNDGTCPGCRKRFAWQR